MNRFANKSVSPWIWIPTLYFVEGLPYYWVNNISVLMFSKMGVPNGQMALFTSLLYLPWTLKFLWSPFVDILKTKRWWMLTMQAVMAAAFVLLTLTLPHPSPEAVASGTTPMSLFSFTLILFVVAAFASATHDISCDGFYMLSLPPSDQAAFIGVRNTFYRLANVFGNGVIVAAAGFLETRTGDVPLAWQLTLGGTAVLLAGISIYHSFAVPKTETPGGQVSKKEPGQNPALGPSEGPVRDPRPDSRQDGCKSPSREAARAGGRSNELFANFGATVSSYFRKRGVWLAVAFMLFFRLPEALLLKMCTPFLGASRELGGLGMQTAQIGLAYGTIGVVALLAGGILGGLYASKVGLRRCIWPMAASIAVPCFAYVYLALAQPTNLAVISLCVAVDQFGYGLGNTAYMLYLMRFSEGEFQTSHYAFCTCFMALGMMLPGMVAGYIQEWIGYSGLFWLVMACCLATFTLTFLARRGIDPNYGRRQA